jgi:hypothetical protein
MIQEVQQSFTDTTMQHEPTDFRDFYKSRVRQFAPAVSGVLYIVGGSSIYYFKADITSGSQIDVEAVEGRQWLPGGFVVSSVERSAGLLLNRPIQRHDPQPEAEPEEIPDVFAPPHHRRVIFSTSIEVHTASLPRLKPHIPLDPDILDMLSEEEDD